MNAATILCGFAEEMGWDTEEQLSFCLDFIDSGREDFSNYLAEKSEEHINDAVVALEEGEDVEQVVKQLLPNEFDNWSHAKHLIERLKEANRKDYRRIIREYFENKD